MIANMSPGRKNRDEESMEEGSKKRLKGNNNGSSYNDFHKKMNIEDGDYEQKNNKQHMPPASVMTRLILIMVWRKLIRNPNTYSSLIGVIWSLVSYRWHIEMPTIIKGSISILSDAGLGMAMFSLGIHQSTSLSSFHYLELN